MNNETKKCPKCKEEILKDAIKCKHCSADQRNWFMQHKVLSFFLLFFVVLLFILAMASLGSARKGAINNSQVITVDNQNIVMTFDVPSLIGKNIDEIKNILGAPVNDIEPSKMQLEYGVDEWDKTFKKNGFELLVTYNPTTKKIIDFFIPTNDPSGSTTNTDNLLIIGNLKRNSTNYKIENVKTIKDPSLFTGIKISY